MDKDDLIRQLDRRLKIRAMFAFEGTAPGRRDAEREFVERARELVDRQPAMADLLDVPEDLLTDEVLGHG